MGTFNCKICGKTANTDHFYEEYAKELEQTQMCHTCRHWQEQNRMDREVRGPHGFAIIDAVHYVLGPANTNFKGFGGRNFIIRFNDGHIAACDNLWCQGDIPEGHWRDLMPDNATFITE